MKIFYSSASPFVRKVLVVASERGLRDRIELIESKVSPIDQDPTVRAHNPTGKIPTLLLDDGRALYDSRVIVEYLDRLAEGGTPVLPSADPERTRALVLQSLADEMTDAAVLLRYETFLRPEALRWPEWIAGQRQKIHTSFDELERQVDALRHFDLGAIAVACAIGYLDFRFPDDGWRETHPQLAAWYAEVTRRPSLAQTQPR